MAQFFANDDIVSLQDTLIPTPGETVFTAQISTVSDISLQSPVEWITGASDNGTVYTIVFETGFFSTAPAITVTPQIANRNLTLSAVSATGCTVTATTGSCRFTIIAIRSGADYDAARNMTTRLGDL